LLSLYRSPAEDPVEGTAGIVIGRRKRRGGGSEGGAQTAGGHGSKIKKVFD